MMANTNYGERIARMEEKVDGLKEDNAEIKNDLKKVIKRLDNLDGVFVTRREVAVIKGAIGLIATVLGIYISIKGL